MKIVITTVKIMGFYRCYNKNRHGPSGFAGKISLDSNKKRRTPVGVLPVAYTAYFVYFTISPAASLAAISFMASL